MNAEKKKLKKNNKRKDIDKRKTGEHCSNRNEVADIELSFCQFITMSHAKAIEEFQDRPMAIPYSPQTKQTKHGFTHNLFHGIWGL